MAKIGVIGLGMMGRTHIEAYEHIPGAELVAVADADPRRAAGDLSGIWSNIDTSDKSRLPMDRIKGFTDYHQLLALPEVDVVDICLPTPAHTEVVLAALATGKHVVCEKPLARTLAEAQKIAAAAGKAKGFFMPAMCIRFWPAYVWLKKAVVEKRYGRVRSAIFRRRGTLPPGWFMNGKMSGGALLDLHIHDTDFVYYLFGMPLSVSSQGYVGPTGEIDHVLTQYSYRDVPLVVAEGCWCLAKGHPFSMTYHVNFEQATAAFEPDGKVTLYRDGQAEVIDVGSGMGYQAELEYFLGCVQRNERPTQVTAQDAAAGVRLAEAEAASVRTGRPVSLNAVKKAPAAKAKPARKAAKKKPAKKAGKKAAKSKGKKKKRG
ncbi:MAG: Gfo/Idh/MocA family oxidoreductase [Phycisphaeraceae bacterium]|nr:Gfo/Idh/MocA family oxidoreductase [Phycisphaeraceae bacterium]